MISMAYVNPLGALPKLVRVPPINTNIFETPATPVRLKENRQTKKQTNLKQINKQTNKLKQITNQKTNNKPTFLLLLFFLVKRISQIVLPINTRN